jgi:gliding motility-associated-like protein
MKINLYLKTKLNSMNRLSNYYRALLLFLITAFYSAGAYAQCKLKLTGATEGCNPLTVGFDFTDSSGKPLKATNPYSWDFGDGNSSTDPPPKQYIYTKHGTFNPSLTITYADGSKCVAKLPSGVNIKVYDLPVANMVLPNAPGNRPTQCFKTNGVPNRFCFTHTSHPGADGNPIVRYVWNFGDGDTSGVENPCHSYQAPGVYTITLEVTDSKGCIDKQTQSFAIKVLTDITPDFSIGGTQGCDSSVYTFINKTDTTGMWLRSFDWDFGDGSPKNTTDWNSVKHSFTKAGSFKVSLHLVNALGCENTITQIVKNTIAKLHIQFKDTVCYAGNVVAFAADEIQGATYWQWNFGDPASGPKNIAPYQWNTVHNFLDGPRNYQIHFTVNHPVCGTLDTCIILHLLGPMAEVSLPGPPLSAYPQWAPSNYFPAYPMPKSVFTAINAQDPTDQCLNTTVTYSVFTKNGAKTDTIYKYCNAPVVRKTTAKAKYCGRDSMYYNDSIFIKSTAYTLHTYIDSTEKTLVWSKGQTIPANPYYPSKGIFPPESRSMHDSNLYTCKLPNLVRFTNNSVKYRLYKVLDDDPALNYQDIPLARYAKGGDWRDTCQNKNYPFASDSMVYYWKFNDPTGKPCTSNASNRNWDCNFSTLAAPYHLYKGPSLPASRCQTFSMSVTDPKTGCADSTTQQLKQGPPQAYWDRTSNGYCKMNWEMQQILPRGSVGGNPLRGFRLVGSSECAGPEFAFRIDLTETLPSCSAQDWWITFDSAATTKVLCKHYFDRLDPFDGHVIHDSDITYDYGFLGANNKLGQPSGANKQTWLSPPYNGNYWYPTGDQGCKTVGVRLKNGDCIETAFYHNYICFNKLDAAFNMYREDSLVKNNQVTISRAFIDSSEDYSGRVCHFFDQNTNPTKAGFTLLITPHDTSMDLVSTWKIGITRREFPANDWYYRKPFWSDTATLYPWIDLTDSFSAVTDTVYIPKDSFLYTTILNNNRLPIGTATLNGFYITKKQLDDLNANGVTYVPPAELLARRVTVNCRQDTVAIHTYQQPVIVQKQETILKLHDDKHSKTRDRFWGQTNPVSHDTIPVRIMYPGFYTIQSVNTNLDGCLSGVQYHLIYGHFARFSILGSDSVICVGDTVRFGSLVRYWTTNCQPPPGGGLPPDGCIDGLVGGFPGIFSPFNKPDPTAYRKAILPSWKSELGYQKEKMDWNFGDNPNYEQAGKDTVLHVYTKPGVYSVTLRTKDSLGCTIYTTRHKLIKVVALDANFTVKPLRDTLTFCAPRDITFKDLTTMLGGDVNRYGYFGYKDKVVKNGKIVDTVYYVDSIAAYVWDPGDGRTPVTRIHTDTAVFHYTHNGNFTVSITAITGNKPKGCQDKETKTSYIHIMGPVPDWELYGDTAGCIPFTAHIRNRNDSAVSYQWNLGDSSQHSSNRGDSLVTLLYNKVPGRFRITVLQADSIYDSFQGKWVLCYTTWPDITDTTQYYVTVYPRSELTITGDTLICPRTSASFKASSPRGEYKSYTWTFGDGSTVTGTDSAVKHVYQYAGVRNGEIGKYQVTVRAVTEHGCIQVDTFSVRVDTLKTDYTIDSSQAQAGIFTFHNHSKGGVKYHWDFGDGTTKDVTDTSDVIHDYTATAKSNGNQPEGKDNKQQFHYNVCLTSFSQIGCPDTVCKPVQFLIDWQHYNVFTPNGDGVNDIFLLHTDGALEYNVQIFNRWGEKVFESNDATTGWNGKINNTGNTCPDGALYYQWKFKLIGGFSKVENGSVTILR